MVGNRFSRTGLELASDSAGKSFEVNQESEFQNYVETKVFVLCRYLRLKKRSKSISLPVDPNLPMALTAPSSKGMVVWLREMALLMATWPDLKLSLSCLHSLLTSLTWMCQNHVSKSIQLKFCSS